MMKHDTHARPAARGSRLRGLLWLASLASLLGVAACGAGGGDQPPTPPPVERLFEPQNAWPGPDPDDAQWLSEAEFRRQHAAGELTLDAPGTQQAQQQALRQQLTQDLAYLESLPDRDPALDDLVARARAANDPWADAHTRLPDGTRVALLDLAAQVAIAAQSRRLASDAANALAVYTMSHGLLPPELQAQATPPAALAGAGLQAIEAAAAALEDQLQQADPDPVRLLDEAQAARGQRRHALSAGNGVDHSGPCAPTGLYTRYWWPLKHFVSPVKDQAARGTCWAFTALAAVESRERVQNNSSVDLSEQFLVNKYRREWERADFVDSGSALAALNAAVQRRQTLVRESTWTYNPSRGRPDNAFAAGVAGTGAAYTGACDDYESPWCSLSAHQSQRSCTRVLGFSFCAYHLMNHAGPGVQASRARQVWRQGQAFPLATLRQLLDNGHSLMAAFPVHAGFDEAERGVVSDYRTQQRVDGELVEGSRGGHQAQIVGFISNAQMSFPGAPSRVGGGGYFVLRNSWSCSGDGGYWYVPADYVSSLFTTLEVLDFDARRSSAWTAEQQAPGSTQPLAVQGGGTLNVDLRVAQDLAGSFSVTHPDARHVRLTVRSDVDGVLYDGQWQVNPPPGGSLFGNALRVTFPTEGARTLTLTARYGNRQAGGTLRVVAVNSRPVLTLRSSEEARQGEAVTVQAQVSDRNETDPAGLCARMRWQVDAPDAIVGGDGCTRTVRFGAQGAREVRADTTDREGLGTVAVLPLWVQPPPANPFPRVQGAGLFARENLVLGTQAVGCTQRRVADGATVDLRQSGCQRLSLLPQPPLTRFLGQVTLDNPAQEALTYDWRLTQYFDGQPTPARVRNERTTLPELDLLPSVLGGRDTPLRCELSVRVNAPDPARSKQVAVWSGRCINVEDAPR
jgi:C1A family cysteine protease